MVKKSEAFVLGLLPHKKEINLLLNSRVLDDYLRLKNLIEQHKLIKTTVFRKLSTDDQEYLRTYALRVLRQAQKEWVLLGDEYVDLGEDFDKIQPPISCELCGRSPLRHKHCIENRFTSKRLIIGGDCKDDFYTKDGITADEVEASRRALNRKSELDTKFPGILYAVERSDRIWDDLEMMIPKRLKNMYYSAAQELSDQFERYVSGKVNKTTKVSPAWERFKKVKEKLVAFDEKQRGNLWKATRKIEKHMLNNRQHHELQLLDKDDCTITLTTVWRITERTFLENLIPLWNQHLSTIGIAIKGLGQEGKSYVYSCDSHPGVEFTITHKQLADKYGELLFGQEPIEILSEDNIVKESTIVRATSSQRIALEAIINCANEIGYQLEEIDEGLGRIIFKDTTESIFIQTNIRELVSYVGSSAFYKEDGCKVFKEYLNSQHVQTITAEQLRRQREATVAFKDSLKRRY